MLRGIIKRLCGWSPCPCSTWIKCDKCRCLMEKPAKTVPVHGYANPRVMQFCDRCAPRYDYMAPTWAPPAPYVLGYFIDRRIRVNEDGSDYKEPEDASRHN